MKKNFFLALVAFCFASCATTAPTPQAKLVSSATHNKVSVVSPVAAVFADLEVSPEKISFFYIPSKTVIEGGYDNVVDSAVREALASNGNADVLVALETQVKYNAQGKPESITVTGYPAKYVNFRNAGDDYLRNLAPAAPAKSAESGKGFPMGKLKLGK